MVPCSRLFLVHADEFAFLLQVRGSAWVLKPAKNEMAKPGRKASRPSFFLDQTGAVQWNIFFKT